jgi:hypothetical protein
MRTTRSSLLNNIEALMAKSNEILQIQMPKDNSLVALKQLVQELNQHLFTLSQRPVPYYTHLPNAAHYDFILTDFITDNQWHALELSSILPTQAKLAHIFSVINDDATSFIAIQAYDEQDEYNRFANRISVADIPSYAEGILDVSNSKRLRYRASNTTFTTIGLKIRGYWSW